MDMEKTLPINQIPFAPDSKYTENLFFCFSLCNLLHPMTQPTHGAATGQSAIRSVPRLRSRVQCRHAGESTCLSVVCFVVFGLVVFCWVFLGVPLANLAALAELLALAPVLVHCAHAVCTFSLDIKS